MGTPVVVVVVDVSDVDATLCWIPCVEIGPLKLMEETDDGTVLSGGLNGDTPGLNGGIDLPVGKGSYQD